MGNVKKGKSQRKTSKNAKKPKLPNKTLIKVKQYSEENMAAALRDVRLGKPVATAAKEHCTEDNVVLLISWDIT